MEQWWVENAGRVASSSKLTKQWKTGCAAITAETARISKWLATAWARESSAESEWSSDVFSYYEHNCSGELLRLPIEPLFGMLRHPRFHCFGCPPCTHPPKKCVPREEFKTALNKSYLLLPWREELLQRPSSLEPPPFWSTGRAYHFDIGASTYAAGDGGASMGWFIRSYQRRGITFDRVLAWEATPHKPQRLFAEPMPQDVLYRLSYYNVPVVATWGHRHNPLSALASLVQPQDFVVVKVDFDQITIETELVQQMLAPQLVGLIDELFFEQHVGDIALARYKYGPKTGTTLALSFQLFSTLRRAGIRAHTWV